MAKFENITFNIKNYSVIFNETSKNFHITLTIKVNQDAIQSCRYSIDGRIGEVRHSKCLLGEEYDDFTVTDLPPYIKNTIVMDLNNNCGTVDNDALDFTTYHVQNLTISTEGNGSVSVQCVYAESSTADGCHVIFTHTVSGRNESFNVTGSGNTIISLPASGSYTVIAFDIYNGSLYGPSLEHFKQVNVILDSPDHSTTVYPTSTNSPPNVSVSVPPSPIDVESPDNDSKIAILYN
ncbi:PREDICTED: uncharacterized protein LOC109589856 [Amphimedon queenslandica]|uniref:Uncharacterized protein n=2 Tax=Amphimedon queenslandica TaxID=400682 RepID=A0AAN0JWY1_AMPQE|nr:PREDICTED: uncharacterized protein LOC109589856 [Amphimedon queenslandica]|eukprot:XP_019861408.1 PREDICTED: uncharacterized protein LOC109589856 [Amphimedon queenslandica]